ncbi:hypothetical protein KKF34_17870 [Myxococcota bacterium]|nr:hypothetical protein [Myxococcota bacterium]MBU1382158.1 hypothetical protein [Myxococcota bacterium]MBU1498752.1 hypothetical protein [Myxococcota bacterium]
MIKILTGFIFTIIFAVGCNPEPPVRYKRYVAARAVEDLSCTKEGTTYVQLEKTKYAARGCGAYAIYRVKCNEIGVCKALMIQVPRADNGEIVDSTVKKPVSKPKRKAVVTPDPEPDPEPSKPKPSPMKEEKIIDEPDLTPEKD